MRYILYYLGVCKYAIIIGVVVILWTTDSCSVLNSSNPVIIVPLAVILTILIAVVCYFKRITPRRRLYDETT